MLKLVVIAFCSLNLTLSFAAPNENVSFKNGKSDSDSRLIGELIDKDDDSDDSDSRLVGVLIDDDDDDNSDNSDSRLLKDLIDKDDD